MGYGLPKRTDTATDRPTLSLRSKRRRVARRGLAIAPTACTLMNLICGFWAVFLASRPLDTQLMGDISPLTWAAMLIFLGMVFDGLDGLVARLVRATSELGEQLDSMADMVTFGIAPAFIVIQLVGVGTPYFGDSDHFWARPVDRLVICVGIIYICCAALRLARFNAEIDRPEESDHMSFKGLPSPGAAGTVASLVILQQHFLAHERGDDVMWWTAVGIVAVTGLVGFAMVSLFRYPHFVNRYIKGRAPISNIAKGVAVVAVLSLYPQIAMAAAFVLYAASAPAFWLLRRIRPSVWSRRPRAAR